MSAPRDDGLVDWDMPRLQKTLGITLDSLLTPHAYHCGGCGGLAWGWSLIPGPLGRCVCWHCTTPEGLVAFLCELEANRVEHGLTSLQGTRIALDVLNPRTRYCARCYHPGREHRKGACRQALTIPGHDRCTCTDWTPLAPTPRLVAA